MRLVAKSILTGYTPAFGFILEDADLDALRKDPRFKTIIDGVKVINDLGAASK
jgi:hypothetical protein